MCREGVWEWSDSAPVVAVGRSFDGALRMDDLRRCDAGHGECSTTGIRRVVGRAEVVNDVLALHGDLEADVVARRFGDRARELVTRVDLARSAGFPS